MGSVETRATRSFITLGKRASKHAKVSSIFWSGDCCSCQHRHLCEVACCVLFIPDPKNEKVIDSNRQRQRIILVSVVSLTMPTSAWQLLAQFPLPKSLARSPLRRRHVPSAFPTSPANSLVVLPEVLGKGSVAKKTTQTLITLGARVSMHAKLPLRLNRRHLSCHSKWKPGMLFRRKLAPAIVTRM